MPCDSFFNFFSPPKAPADEEEVTSDDIEERLELDYQLGEDIKEKIIPRAIDWFTGEALQFESLLDDEDDGEFEDEDDEDDDDLSEDRDEDDSDEDVRPEILSCTVFVGELTKSQVDGPKSAKQDAAECKQS